MWNWLKDDGTALIVLAAILTVILTSNNAIHHRLNDIRTDMNQRFDAVNQRFDAQDQRLGRLADEVAELRKLTISIGERVSRSEGRIEIIREQIRTVDIP